MAEEAMATAAQAGAAEVTTPAGEGAASQATQEAQEPLSIEAIERLVQSRVDKITAEMGKKNATLQKELDKAKKEKMSDDEVRKLELADKEKALTEKEQALLERENRLFAIKAMKENGLDDGDPRSLELIDFVMAGNEEAITERVKAFKGLVDRFVNARVDQTFKANGRVPNGSGKASGGASGENNIALELGKKAAESAKKSEEILNYYYGGKK